MRYPVWKYKPESGFAGFFGIFRIRAVLDGVGVPGRVFTSVCERLRVLSESGFAGFFGIFRIRAVLDGTGGLDERLREFTSVSVRLSESGFAG